MKWLWKTEVQGEVSGDRETQAPLSQYLTIWDGLILHHQTFLEGMITFFFFFYPTHIRAPLYPLFHSRNVLAVNDGIYTQVKG